MGALAPRLNGYGTWTDFAIGVGVPVGSLVLFFYRRVVQDRETVHWSEVTPSVPDHAELAELGPVATPSGAAIAGQRVSAHSTPGSG